MHIVTYMYIHVHVPARSVLDLCPEYDHNNIMKAIHKVKRQSKRSEYIKSDSGAIQTVLIQS